MSHKRLVVGTGVGLLAVIVLFVLMTFSFSMPETINPFAALTAVVVALVGFVWFKKTSN
jgi:archaellum biogenesis protein FlaJ (TadC family)